ncbi:MAG: hypothetical protein HY689_09110 [Chloroflexi bacterium]|nr:hypothetical protein [Chloroflexota bacterium]
MIRAFVLGVLLVGGLVALLAFDGASTAYATGGPHGDYTATTDSCAACHRAHTALADDKLLKTAAGPGNNYLAVALCTSCHNGLGSQLSVMDGVRLDIIDSSYKYAIGDLPGGTKPTIDSTIRSATSASLEVTVEPQVRQIAAGDSVKYLVRVKNTTAGNVSVTPSAAVSDSGNFSAAVSPAVATSIAGGKTLDVWLTVTAGAGATAGKADLTTVTITAGAETPEVVVKSRNGAWLLGGGFQFIDGAPISSRHLDAVAGTEHQGDADSPWGYAGTDATRDAYANISGMEYAPGDTNPGQTGLRAGESASFNKLGAKLECISCHNPHGTRNYRLLKEELNGYKANVKAYNTESGEIGVVYNEGKAGLNGTGELARRGLEGDPDGTLGKYTDAYERYYSAGSNVLLEGSLAQGANDNNATFASFCSTCHTAYPSNSAMKGLTTAGQGTPVTITAISAHAAVGITSSSVATETVITTSAAHNLATGDYVAITGHTGSTPAISGRYQVTVLTATTFTIPVDVTVGGTGGTVQRYTWITAAAHGLTTGDSVNISGSNSTPTINGTYTVTVKDVNTFTVDVLVTTAGTAGTVAETGGGSSITHYRHVTEAAVTGRPGCGWTESGQCDNTTNPETAGLDGYKLRLATNATNANEYVTCVTCHRAHGTTSVMGPYSRQAAVAEGKHDFYGEMLDGKGSLLFLDNRGVCQVCHQWPSAYSGP